MCRPLHRWFSAADKGAHHHHTHGIVPITRLHRTRAAHALFFALNALVLHPLLLLGCAIFPPLVGILRAHVPEAIKTKAGDLPGLGASLLYRVPLVVTFTQQLISIALTYQLSIHQLVAPPSAIQMSSIIASSPPWTHIVWWRWFWAIPWSETWLLTWLCSSVAREAFSLLTRPAAYLSNQSKMLELPAQCCALLALGEEAGPHTRTCSAAPMPSPLLPHCICALVV